MPMRFVAESVGLVAEEFTIRGLAVLYSLVRSYQLLCCGGAVVGPSTVFYANKANSRPTWRP